MIMLRERLNTGQDFSLTYDDLSYEPCENLEAYQQILAEAKSHGYGVTNSVSDRRMYFWKRDEPKKGRK